MTHDEQPVTLPAVPTTVLLRWRSHRALSDLERLNALIDFANTGSVSAYRKLYSGVDLTDPPLSPAQRYWAEHKPRTDVIQPGQLELREALAKVEAGKVSPRVVALWRRRAAGLVFVRAPDGDAEPRYGYMAFEQWKSGPTPAVAHLLLLLLAKPFKGKLHHCGLKSCGRIFLQVQPAGRRSAPIRKYCPDTDHRELAHKEGAAGRMAALRRARKHK